MRVDTLEDEALCVRDLGIIFSKTNVQLLVLMIRWAMGYFMLLVVGAIRHGYNLDYLNMLFKLGRFSNSLSLIGREQR